MEFTGLQHQYKIIEDNILKSIKKVLSSGKYIMGPEIDELENELKSRAKTKYAITCSSGTDALLISLMAYKTSWKDAIITTPFTFVSTAEAILLTGAIPVFVDINPMTFNINSVSLKETLKFFKGKLNFKGIIAVDLFGQPADYDSINEIAKEYGLFVIEDAAQSFGATYKNKPACSLADIGVTSFFPTKPLGCYGDGGVIFTNDDKLAEILYSIRVHGNGKDKYDSVRVGINGRLDTIQAAILLEKLKIFDKEINYRRELALRYDENLHGHFEKPYVNPNCISSWSQYSMLSDNRDKIRKFLDNRGIPTFVYYPIPLHLQKTFKDKCFHLDLSVSERVAKQIFSIPIHPYLTDKEQDKVINTLLEFEYKG